MIETLVMPLPSGVTKAIIDIAVVLGELFLLMITMCYLLYRWIIISVCFSLTIPVSIILSLCTLLCHYYSCHTYL